MVSLVFVISLVLVSALGATLPCRRRPRLDGCIVGGKPADITHFPYQVSLEFFEEHYCGGSIIHLNFVVTAGHCVDGIPVEGVTLRAGTSTREEGGVVHQASEIIPHPNYDYNTLDYDIAVVKISDSFAWTSSVQRISFLSVEPEAGAESVVTGWGTVTSGGSLSDILQKVYVKIFDRDKCNTLYKQYGEVTENMICAGVEEDGKYSCQGDYGDPLAVDGKLVGIVSWGLGCGVRGFPGVYTNVAALSGFILDAIR